MKRGRTPALSISIKSTTTLTGQRPLSTLTSPSPKRGLTWMKSLARPKPKKKSVGPASYNTDSAVLKLSSYKKTTINIPISGIGVVFGSKPITH